jgi:hypothetical protein
MRLQEVTPTLQGFINEDRRQNKDIANNSQQGSRLPLFKGGNGHNIPCFI